MTDAVERYESLRNGKIGTVVSRTESEVILDIEGNHKTIKVDALKKWYKPCGIIEEEDVKKENKQASKVEQLNKRIDKADKPNGDNPPKEDCSALANKIITHLEKNGCLTKKTCSYTRIRVEGAKRNLAELWFGKKLTALKLVVRSEAIRENKELYEMGRTVPPTHMYTLDHIYKFNNSSDVSKIYAILDMAIKYEKTAEKKPHPGAGKRGTGKIDGKQSLASKRKAQGTKSDDEKAKEQTEEAKAENKQPVAVE